MRKILRFRYFSIGLTYFWLLAFAVVPTLLMLAASFMGKGETEYLLYYFTTDAYSRLFDPSFMEIFADSLKLAAGSTILCLLLGYPFAYILARLRGRLKQFLLVLLIIPFWTNSLIRTYSLIAIIRTGGLLETVLNATGLHHGETAIMYTNTAVFIGMVYTLLPFMILPLYASIEKLDRRMLEAAYDLGAGRWTAFVRVTIPLTSPGIVAGCILVFLAAIGMFYIPDILGGARGMLLGNFIRDQFLSAGDWPLGAAASVVMTGLMVVMILVYYRCRQIFEREEAA